MSLPSEKFEIVELAPNSPPEAITAAARTICHAFSEDPLIQWLRPAARPWGELGPETMAWQTSRIHQNMVDGRVFAIKCLSRDQEHVLPAVAFLVEPFSLRFWLSRAVRRFYLWLAESFSPIRDGLDEQRVVTMMKMHDSMIEMAREKCQRPINYIEVVAVDPNQQGAGLGSRILKHVVSQCNPNTPVILESTRDKNISFYERHGFRVSDDGTLECAGDPSKVRLWLMSKE